MSLIHAHRHSHQDPEDEEPTSSSPVDLDEPAEEPSVIAELTPAAKTPNRLTKRVGAAAVGVLVLASGAAIAATHRSSGVPVSSGPVPTAGGEAPAQQPGLVDIHKAPAGQIIDYGVTPTATIGDQATAVPSGRDKAKEMQDSLDLATFYSQTAGPAVKEAAHSKGQLTVSVGCYTETSKYKNPAGDIFTVLKATVNPAVTKKGDMTAYTGFQEDGISSGASVLYKDGQISRAAFGADEPRFYGYKGAPGGERTVQFSGVLGTEESDSVEQLPGYVGNLSTSPNIHWEKTGAVGVDPDDHSKKIVIGGFVNVIAKGDAGFTPEQVQNVCDQLVQTAGVSN